MSDDLFVKYVASNVKGGVSCLLGQKTLIVGPNGSGKSAVINALELALAGFASDIAGRREIKKETELYALAPGRQGELFARAILSDNTEAKWMAGVKGAMKKVHTLPASVDPTRVFPLLPVRDAIEGKPETARKFFLEYALPGLTKDDVMKRIPEGLHPLFLQSTLSADMKASPVDKLLLALEHASKQARGGKKKAAGQVEVADTVADGLEPLPTEEVVAALKAQQKEAQKAIDVLTKAEGAAEQIAKMRIELESVHAKLQQAEANVAQLQAAVHQADGVIAQTPAPAIANETINRVVSLVTEMATLEHTQQQAQCCPVCKTNVELGRFLQRYQTLQAYFAAEQAKAGPYEMAVASRNQVYQNLIAWQAKMTELRTQHEALQSSVAAGNVQAPTKDQLDAARALLKKIDGELMRIDTLKAQWDQARKAKEVASDTDKVTDQWVELRDACTQTIAELLDAGVNRFISRVQGFLPDSDRFNLHLREDKKQVFRFGLQRGDVLHTALSGAEWARVMGAIAGACADASKLSVLVPEERAFDGETLYATLGALLKVPGQIIIAAPNFPVHGGKYAIPDGWNLVDTAKNSHRNAELKAA